MERRAKVELFERIRREYEFGIGSIKGVAARLGVHRRMVRQALMSAEPPERKPVMRARPVMGPLIEFIDAILESDRMARLHMIPFPQKWDETPDHSRNILKADKDLMDKLEPEAPGILQKLIDALHDYQRRGFDPPRTVRDASEKYLVDQDMLAQWMTECCYISNPNETDTVNNLWANWLAWAERHKEFIGKRTAFMDGLERAGVQISRTSGQRGICSGIRLRESANI